MANDTIDDLGLTASPFPAALAIQVKAEMVLQIATGMEDEYEVAARFGLTSDQYDSLRKWPPFVQAVQQKQAELKASGATFRLQMAFMAEDLGKDVYRIAKSNEASFPQKLETFRTLTKLADLEPKPSATVAAGPGFSIVINLPNPRDREEKTIEGSVAESPADVAAGVFRTLHVGGAVSPGVEAVEATSGQMALVLEEPGRERDGAPLPGDTGDNRLLDRVPGFEGREGAQAGGGGGAAGT